MRKIATLEREPAHLLGDYLVSEGITNQVDEEDDGGATVWVHDEGKLDRARALYEGFRSDPDVARSAAVLAAAAKLREEEAAAERRRGSSASRRVAGSGVGPVTTLLIALSVGLTLATEMGANAEVFGWFTLTADVLRGQVWRLFTPMFIHLSLLHIVFNMLWLHDLGSVIERLRGTLYFSVFVLALAAGSNLCQFLASGSGFGGMSGVVYGLLGYLWVTGRRDPGAGVVLSQNTLVWMIGWLVLCLTGLMGPVANTAHVTGLLGGMAVAFVHAAWRNRRRAR